MSGDLIIRRYDGRWTWSDAAAGSPTADRELAELGELPRASGKPLICTLLLPAEMIFLGRAAIATRNQKQLRQAAPFAVEEQLASEPENLHFATQILKTDPQVGIAAVHRDYLRGTLEELQESGLEPERALPDALLLPWQVGAISVLLEDGRAMLRYGEFEASAMESTLLGQWLPLAIAGMDPAPEKIICYGPGDPAQHQWPLPVEVHELPRGVSGLLAKGLPDAGLNLLHGPFQAASEPGQAGAWKAPAIAAAVAAALVVIINIVEVRNLKNASARLDEAIATRFRQSFPQVQKIQDPIIQAQRELEQLRGGRSNSESDFNRLLGGIAAAIAAQSDLELTSVRFRNGQMQLELEASGIDQLEQLQQAAQTAGLDARLDSARLGAEGVSGTLTLARAPS